MSDFPQQAWFAEAQQREVGKRLRRVWALSPDERMARFFVLQAAAWTSMQSNPAALAAFHRRNRSARRHSNAQRLVAEMKKSSDEST